MDSDSPVKPGNDRNFSFTILCHSIFQQMLDRVCYVNVAVSWHGNDMTNENLLYS